MPSDVAGEPPVGESHPDSQHLRGNLVAAFLGLRPTLAEDVHAVAISRTTKFVEGDARAGADPKLESAWKRIDVRDRNAGSWRMGQQQVLDHRPQRPALRPPCPWR
jgi:hypothetical protein